MAGGVAGGQKGRYLGFFVVRSWRNSAADSQEKVVDIRRATGLKMQLFIGKQVRCE